MNKFFEIVLKIFYKVSLNLLINNFNVINNNINL